MMRDDGPSLPPFNWRSRRDWEAVVFVVVVMGLVGWAEVSCMKSAEQAAKAGHPWITIIDCDSIPRGMIVLTCVRN